jgi:hypothetical protein
MIKQIQNHSSVLEEWINGNNLPTYDKTNTKPFIYWKPTPIVDGDLNSKFDNNISFYEHETNTTKIHFDDELKRDQHVIFKSRTSKNETWTYLVCPATNGNTTKFKSIKYFIDNASMETQKSFWKFVAKGIKDINNNNNNNKDTLYVFTEGTAEPYLHVRIQNHNKYYYSS